MKVLGGVVGAAALLGLGIIVGHFAIPKGADSPAPSASASQDLDREILKTVIEQLDANRIRENLRSEACLCTSPVCQRPLLDPGPTPLSPTLQRTLQGAASGHQPPG